MKFFTETDVHAMMGTVHTVLAQTVDVKHTRYAIPMLQRAIDSYGDDMARSKTFNLSQLATNHLLEGDIDHGAKIGRGAVDLAENLTSGRTKDRMRPLKQEADKRRNNTHARELCDVLNKYFNTDI